MNLIAPLGVVLPTKPQAAEAGLDLDVKFLALDQWQWSSQSAIITRPAQPVSEVAAMTAI
jgi:hypothetical protein